MSVIRASDGCTLYYDRAGDGRPVILIPGLGGAASFWNGVAARLSRSRVTIAVDHRGAGRSDRPDGVYTIDQIARDVLSIMDAEGIASADIIGHSTGGAVAQTLALDAAPRVRSLILSATWAGPDAHFRQLFETRLDILLKAGPACYQRLTHLLGYTAAYLNAHADELEAAVAQAQASMTPLGVAAARIRMLLAFDRRADARRIAAPCCVIGVTDDAVVPFHHSEELAGLIAGANLLAVDGAHFHPRVQPERFVAMVEAHLPRR